MAIPARQARITVLKKVIRLTTPVTNPVVI